MPHDDALMTEKQRQVWGWLVGHHAGAANAAARTSIIERFNTYHVVRLNDREFRQICSDLVTHWEKPICATSDGGYFVARTPDELSHAIADLEARAVTILERAKALKAAIPLEPQGRLFS